MGKTLCAFLLLAAVPGFGQALVEHGVAAAGASAGAAAGKVVSDGLTGLGNLLGAAAKTAEPKQEMPKEMKPDKAPARPPAAKQSYGAPAGGSSAASAASYAPQPYRVAQAEPREELAPVPVSAPVAAVPEPRQARSEDLERVQPGMSRSEVLAIGAFSSRITIPGDDGHVLEVLQYDHATVRMEDGKVTSVSRN